MKRFARSGWKSDAAPAGLPGEDDLLHVLAAEHRADLRAVGVEIELKGVSYAAFESSAGARRKVPCGVFGWVEDYPDPSTFLDTLFNGERITAENCNNLAFYNNPEVTHRVNAARETLDPAERTRLFREAESIVLQDAPWVPLSNAQYAIICHPRLHGDIPHPVWLWRYENMWLEP